MKKKVFFLVGSLRAGGSERVFWLLSKYFDKKKFDVSLIVVDMRDPFFSPHLESVNVIDLKKDRIWKSFFKLLRLIKREKPYAVFSTGAHFTVLLWVLSLLVKIPLTISREASVPDLMLRFEGAKEKLINSFIKDAYKRMNIAVCQSEEIKSALISNYKIASEKLVIIPNPVIPSDIRKQVTRNFPGKRLIVISRFSSEKGLSRLLKSFKELPSDYSLTLVGDGPLRYQIQRQISIMELTERVNILGLKSNISELIQEHSVLLIGSYTEGFPNVALEALAVGVPVVSFRVGGILQIIQDAFNGYVVEQDDLQSYRECIIRACNQYWDSDAIIQDVNFRFGINKVVARYQSLIA